MGLAYSVENDVRRFDELRSDCGEKEARTLMMQELVQNLLTHFGELGGEDGRVGWFSFRYLLNQWGELVEDAGARRLIRSMFEGQDSPEALMWQNEMIPFLEHCEVGQSAFFLSAKKVDSLFEGKYDYAYFFIKNERGVVLAAGLELNLDGEEMQKIIQGQIKKTTQHTEYLDERLEPAEVRGLMFAYDKNEFGGVEDGLAEIIGMPLQELRKFSKEEQMKLDNKLGWVKKMADKMMCELAVDRGVLGLQDIVDEHQMEQLWLYDPKMMQDLRSRGVGQVMLPCGAVNLNWGNNTVNFDLRNTAGENVASGYTGEWSLGNCRCCGREGVEVGECSVCKTCQHEFDIGTRN